MLLKVEIYPSVSVEQGRVTVKGMGREVWTWAMDTSKRSLIIHAVKSKRSINSKAAQNFVQQHCVNKSY